MQLSELPLQQDTLQRDEEFFNLGLLQHSGDKQLVCFYDRAYLPELLANRNISCVITHPRLAALLPDHYGVIVAENPVRSFYTIHHYLLEQSDFYWKSFPTVIAASANIHPRAYIAEQDVRIGEHCVIEPNVTVLPRTIIGDGVIIRAGAVLGSEGFEFKRIDNNLTAIRHAGGVKIGNQVEIQANCAISKSVFAGFTEIGAFTKLDNLVHVAHNVKIGSNCRLAAAAMIAGSTTIGDHVWIGPNSTISSEILIGDHAEVTLGAVVTRNVKEHQRVSGNFAVDHDKFMSFLKSIR